MNRKTGDIVATFNAGIKDVIKLSASVILLAGLAIIFGDNKNNLSNTSTNADKTTVIDSVKVKKSLELN